MRPLIPNERLRASDIPSRDADWGAVIRFAQTFNGYEEPGFDACADLANGQRECRSLFDLRACLFFEYRRHNHFGRDPDERTMLSIYDLLDRIRTLLPPPESL